MLRRGALVILACVGAVGTAAAQDLTVTFRTTAAQGAAGALQRLFVSDRFVRVSQPPTEVIVEASASRIVMINLEQKTYYETSYREITAYVESLLPKNRFARAAMKNMTLSAPLKKQNDRRTIAGFECEHFTETVGQTTYHVWATTAIGPPAAYYEVMEKAYAATSPGANPMTAIYAHMRRTRGIPLEIDAATSKVRLMDALSAAMDTGLLAGMGVPVTIRPRAVEVTDSAQESFEVIRQPIQPSTFDLPPGLTRTESPFAPRSK
jgi:hypothetical protein